MDKFLVKSTRASDVVRRKTKAKRTIQKRITANLVKEPRISDVKTNSTFASASTSSRCPSLTNMKQERIENLAGVVSLTMVAEAKIKLASNEESDATKLEILAELSKKRPSVEILRSTKIGKVVKRLQSHANSAISLKAASIVADWEQHIRRLKTRQLIDVKCDQGAISLRAKATEMLRSCFIRNPSGNSVCSAQECDEAPKSNVASLPPVEDFERHVFFYCNRRTSRLYRALIRKITLKLKNSAEMSVEICSDANAFTRLLSDLGGREAKRLSGKLC